MDHPIKSGDDGVGTIGTLSYISPFVIAVRDTAIHGTKVSRGNLLRMDHPIKSGDDGN